MAGIEQLIINSAFREPEHHWKHDYQTQTFIKEPGRRPAGYFVAGQGSNQYNDIGQFIELPLVNMIRPRVKKWRENEYPGVTGITKKLLEHWNDKDIRQYQFFYCQMDAMETLVWLVEAPDAEKVGIDIKGDGGLFTRICTKLCTGGGKTTVMAMLIAWHICNKVTYPQDKRFSKNVFIVAPNLTVKSRLQVLLTGGDINYYTQFCIVPTGMMDKLRQGKVMITNWQSLAWDSEEQISKKKGVDKRGAMSDEAYTRSVLGEMVNAQNILVINDEAHHAWRKNPENKVKLTKEQKELEQEATVWVGGLDRIHKTRRILTCYDFSATPFAPSGKKNDEEALFSWIVTDFGLNDGIESGLVKTPRVVVRDDAAPDVETYRSRLYHIYADPEVSEDIKRAAKEEEPLPDLLTNAYYLLGMDWLEVYKSWQADGTVIPPVMITVANRTETAARIKYAFDHKRIPVEELCVPEYTLHIDSKTLEAAEGVSIDLEIPETSEDEDGEDAPTRKISKKEAAAILRDTVDTAGQRGKRGEQIRNVISVGMLSEGWDAKTVTHIMGLRAFSSQLLCEQVVGRGLRRTSYDLAEGSDMFTPEYVNIFGIPFTFLPHESNDTGTAPISSPKTQVEALPEKIAYEIKWPNIVRLDQVLKPKLLVDIKKIDTLVLDAANTRLSAVMAPIIDGKTDLLKCTEIDLQKLDMQLRMQRIIFEVAGQTFDLMKSSWKREGTKYALLGQIISLVEKYLNSGAIEIHPPLFNTDPIRQRIVYMANMGKIVQHLWNFIKLEQTEYWLPVFDGSKRVRSTSDMRTWFTSKPCCITDKSHVSHCVYDSGWEATESYLLERNPNVVAWVKNDHLGFEITYIFDGVFRKYTPDFLVKLANGTMLILEIKGQETRKDKEKRKALSEWVSTVNNSDEFGKWCCDVSYNIADLDGLIKEHMGDGGIDTPHPSTARFYVEKYDSQQKLLFLDFISQNEYIYFKTHGEAMWIEELSDNEATILLFHNVLMDNAEDIENTIIELNFTDLWQSSQNMISVGSSVVSAEYDDSQINWNYVLEMRRLPLTSEYYYIRSQYANAPFSLEQSSGELSVVTYNVGQGSWNEIVDSQRHYTVFDCGASMTMSEAQHLDILSAAKGLVKPDAVSTTLIISHWDCDHYNLLRQIHDDELNLLTDICVPDRCLSLTSKSVIRKLTSITKKVRAVTSPPRIQKECKLREFYTTAYYSLFVGEQHSSINRSGLALTVTGDYGSAILSGDHSYRQIFPDLVPTSSAKELYLVVPHHGGHAGNAVNISLTKASLAIISTDGKSYGHPYPNVISYLENLGFKTIRTDTAMKNISFRC